MKKSLLQMRGIITESKPNQRLVLFSSQLVPFEPARPARARRR